MKTASGREKKSKREVRDFPFFFFFPFSIIFDLFHSLFLFLFLHFHSLPFSYLLFPFFPVIALSSFSLILSVCMSSLLPLLFYLSRSCFVLSLTLLPLPPFLTPHSSACRCLPSSYFPLSLSSFLLLFLPCHSLCVIDFLIPCLFEKKYAV